MRAHGTTWARKDRPRLDEVTPHSQVRGMPMGRLFDRAVVRVARAEPGEDVAGFLQGLITNDVGGALPVYAGLLTPQGKTLFDFLVRPGGDGALLLDCEAAAADDLAKRLSLYRLRRKLTIAAEPELGVYWSRDGDDGLPDPRLPGLGRRKIAPVDANDTPADDAWRAHRLSLGVPEGRAELGDVLWLETNAEALGGVSFTKGCYVGQENTARMNWRQKVNRRLVVLPLDSSDPTRRKVAYPELGLAVDHARVEAVAADRWPAWLEL
jgi:folate-binding protein YgfZ